MSKKIIYLLSLLMALSLVFASCKKNGAGDISGPGPGDNGNDNSPTTENGLADSSEWLEQNSGDTIKNDPIENFQSEGGVAYFRNPVIVVMGAAGSDVVVFAEKRYKSSGTGNDIGINGNTATDIVYISSVNSGKKWGTPGIVGRTSQSLNGTDAVASPVVFKVDDNTVVVVASAGVGLSRTSQDYDTREKAGQKSELRYTIGTYKDGTFTWNSDGWKDMTTEATAAVSKITKSGFTYKQFATHSGRGVVTGNGNGAKLYFAITASDQGKDGGVKEAMGNVVMEGTYNGNQVSWTEVSSSAVAFNNTKTTSQGTFSDHKETRVISAENGTIEYISVGSPYYANEKIGYGKKGEQPADNGIPGSEGSPSYLVVNKWYGQTSYDPTKYMTENNNKKQRLFAHVKSQISTITMYALGDTGFASTGNPYPVKAYPKDNTTLAKSSSMDVLGDGTIVMVAEQGNTEREYFIVYKRFTQKFLATKLGIQ